jgi:hypothetical protein
MFHIFHKWLPLDQNNIQYCSICGLARKLPIPHQCEKIHTFENIGQSTVQTWSIDEYVDQQIITQKCKIFGILRKYNKTTGSYR